MGTFALVVTIRSRSGQYWVRGASSQRPHSFCLCCLLNVHLLLHCLVWCRRHRFEQGSRNRHHSSSGVCAFLQQGIMPVNAFRQLCVHLDQRAVIVIVTQVLKTPLTTISYQLHPLPVSHYSVMLSNANAGAGAGGAQFRFSHFSFPEGLPIALMSHANPFTLPAHQFSFNINFSPSLFSSLFSPHNRPIVSSMHSNQPVPCDDHIFHSHSESQTLFYCSRFTHRDLVSVKCMEDSMKHQHLPAHQQDRFATKTYFKPVRQVPLMGP